MDSFSISKDRTFYRIYFILIRETNQQTMQNKPPMERIDPKFLTFIPTESCNIMYMKSGLTENILCKTA